MTWLVMEAEYVWFASLGGIIKKVKACVGQLGKKLNFIIELFNKVQEYVWCVKCEFFSNLGC